MAELDPLVAEILLKGDGEFLSSLKKIGQEGAENFEKLASSVEKGVSSFTLAQGALLALEAAFAGVVAATVKFVEEQTELSQKTILLAQSFGTTAGQLQDLEAVFASSGVKVGEFERFVVRLTSTVAREWPSISESIKTYATENDAASLRVTTATQRIREAQSAVADNSRERFAQMAKDTNAVEAAYIKLQFAAQRAALEQINSANAVRGATLSVEAAQQNLATLEGRPPSPAEKQSLAIAQAQQAVDNAQAQQKEARLAQQEKIAQAALKQRQLEQEASDAARKAAKDYREDNEQRIKDENAVKEAVIQRAEAEQKAAKLALTNIASIRDSLDAVVKGNKDQASAVDLTKVSVQHLTDAIIAQAKETSKGASPSGYETLIQLSKTLSAAKNQEITTEQKLAIVSRLAGTQMQALGASAAEILHVLEHNTAELQKFSNAAKALDTEEARHKVEAFRGALAGLNLDISILSQRFAIAVSPAFTSFLNTIRESIESNTGLIHSFIEGIIGIGEALTSIGSKIGTTIDYFTKLFSGGLLKGSDVLKAALIGIGVAITVATGPLGVMLVAIGLIIIAIGEVKSNWDAITAAITRAWDRVKDNAIVKFLTGVLEIVIAIGKGIALIDRLTSIKLPGGGSSGSSSKASEGGDVKGHAKGGEIDGPGTGTSDSILARLSRGEFVIKAAAVQQYGTGLFHALNNMQMPGFAQGGLVPSPVRLGNGASAGPTSTLNLTIGDRTFNGLRGSKSTIDDLASYAVSRQTSAAGSNPQWVK